MFSNHHLSLDFFYSSIKQNIGRRGFDLVRADGRHMAVIEVIPPISTLLDYSNKKKTQVRIFEVNWEKWKCPFLYILHDADDDNRMKMPD